MPKFVQVLLFAVLGFVLAAVAGYFLILWLSSNRHDRAVEAAMTSAFVFGPLGAVLAAVIAYFRAGAS
jgi:hypothetical protein